MGKTMERAWGAIENSGLDNALKTARSNSMKTLGRVRDAMDEVPPNVKVRVMCQVGGAAIVLNGLFGVVDVSEAIDHAIYYIVNLYAVCFGLVTVIAECHPENGTPALYEKVKRVQQWIYDWFRALTTMLGRGLFYIFQGSLAIASSSVMSAGLVIGVYMILAGVVCIVLHVKQSYGNQQDYIRIEP